MMRSERCLSSGFCVLLMLLLLGCSGPRDAGSARDAAAQPARGGTEAAAAAAAERPERAQIRVSYGSVSGSMAPLWIADEKRLFQKYGLDADVQYGESSVGVTALVAGEAQINVNEGVSVIRAIAAGSPLRIVATFDASNQYAIVARPDIASPADLRGQAIALLRPGDTTDISARIALKRFGVRLGDDVQPLQVGNSPNRLAALLTGQVAAALLSEAFVDRAEAEGMHVLVSLEKEHLPYLSTCIITSADFARGSPNSVRAFLQTLIESTRFFADPSNQAEVLPIMARQLNREPTDPAVVDAYRFYRERLERRPFPDRAGAELIMDALREIDPPTYATMTPDQVLDPSFMAALQASGFLDSIWGQ